MAGVGSETNEFSYFGNGATTAFAFNNTVFEAGSLLVELVSLSGAVTTLTLSTHYTVSIASDFSSATVNMVTPPAGDGTAANSEKLVISRNEPFTQGIDYTEGDEFPAETHERGLDRSVLRDQQLKQQLANAFKLTPAQVAAGVTPEIPSAALQFPRWNAAGTALELVGALPDIPITRQVATYTNVANMKAVADTELQVGMYVAWTGYYAAGDGGHGTGVVVAGGTGTDDGGSFHDLANGLQVKTLFTNDVLSVKQFGAVGDGVTNDNSAFAALAATAASLGLSAFVPAGAYVITGTITIDNGVRFFGVGRQSKLLIATGGSAAILVRGSNTSVDGLSLIGSGQGIQVRGISDALVEDVTVRNVYFESDWPNSRITQCVWLWKCNNVVVTECYYTGGSGYGVIQQFGYQANDIVVSNCVFDNMSLDAVEANSGGPVISYRWSVTGCTYTGHATFPYGSSEGRFVGTASVYDVVISDNTIINAGGDSAVHIETTGGLTAITSNTFRDCFGSQGNIGWIYLLDSAKDVIVSNNIFVYSDSSLNAQAAVSMSSNFYSHYAVFSGNLIQDISGTQSFSAFSLASILTDSGIVIQGNTASDINNFMTLSNSRYLVVSGNSVRGAVNGVNHSPGPTGGGSTDIVISGNLIEASTYAITATKNTSGTQPCERWVVHGNMLLGPLRMNDCIDTSVVGNMYSNGVSFIPAGNTFGGGARRYHAMNQEIGVGVYAPSVANPDTSGASLASLETEVNELKAALRTFGVIAT